MVLVPDHLQAPPENWVPPPLGAAPPEASARTPGRGRHRHRSLLFATTGAMALVLVAIAYVGVRYELRGHPGAKSVGSAVQTFRGSGPGADSAGYVVPQAGVYTARGQGSEHISFPPNSQRDGTVIPVTVTHLAGGCWRWDIDYNVAHSEEYEFCASRAGLLQPGDDDSQTWDFGVTEISDTAHITCPASTLVLPARGTPGQSRQWSCPETNTSIGGQSVSTTSARIVGIETLRVGDTPLQAVYELQRTTVTGAQTGTVTEGWWFSRSSGLPLRVERNITVRTASPLGAITYSESGSWQLTSLTPRR